MNFDGFKMLEDLRFAQQSLLSYCVRRVQGLEWRHGAVRLGLDVAQLSR